MSINGNGFTTVASLTPDKPFVGAFELLSTSLRLNGVDGGVHTVTVTSAQSGAGTTTTALNLAMTVAATGAETLLIDANFRSPTLHRPFELPLQPGLGDVLKGLVPLSEATAPTELAHLSLLPAGEVTGSPHAWLDSPRLAQVILEARQRFEFVAVDAPPVLQFADALHIARATDGVILVLPGQAPRRPLVEARRRLERVHARMFGVVLNKIDPRAAVSVNG